MSPDILRSHKSQLSKGGFELQSVLQEIGNELFDNPRPDHKFLVELDIFLRELHKVIRTNKKDIYTVDMQELLITMCAKASYLANIPSNRTKSEKFLKDLQILGKLLIQHAPNFQLIIGLILLMNPDIKFSI